MNSPSCRTVSFSGHRTYDGSADEALYAAVESLFERGFRTFYSGMALGFDLSAAEAVLRLRETRREISLVCAIPFPAQALRFPPQGRLRYERVLAQADRREVVCDSYRPDCYARRNDLLVERASLLLVWYDGRPGGTHYTVRRARACRREIINLRPDLQPDLFANEP